ncbi:MAG: PilZ domain-containing protein [Thermodesulfovibrionales bacterium]|nr:PilZ domain-containing protein [Thermodesulfovibrionales bacterium]
MDNQEQKEQREYERYPFREDILIDGRKQAYSQNICETGMFVSTLSPPKKGSVIHVTIPSILTLKAEVNNSQPGIGMGIEFIDLNYEQKREIKQLIEDIKLGDFNNSSQ